MSRIVHVAIPLVRVKTHLEIQKGQPWSIIEHLILEAIVKSARTVADLARGLQLPRSIVSASLVRLVRIDWVELQEGTEGLRFSATEPGIHAAARHHLPYRYVLSPTARPHLYEQLLGHVFRLDELSHFNRGELPRPGDGELLTQITGPKLPDGFFRIDEVEDCLLDDDEIGDHAALRREPHGIAGAAAFERLQIVGEQPVEPLEPIAAGRSNDSALVASAEGQPLPCGFIC